MALHHPTESAALIPAELPGAHVRFGCEQHGDDMRWPRSAHWPPAAGPFALERVQHALVDRTSSPERQTDRPRTELEQVASSYCDPALRRRDPRFFEAPRPSGLPLMHAATFGRANDRRLPSEAGRGSPLPSSVALERRHAFVGNTERRVKLALMWVLKLNLRDVAAFAGGWPREVAETSTFRDATRVIRRFEERRRRTNG